MKPTTKAAATVELEGVRKEYDGGVVAVHGVDLTVAAGKDQQGSNLIVDMIAMREIH